MTTEGAVQKGVDRKRAIAFPFLRRASRLWAPWLQRVMNFKFPTLGAHLSDEQLQEVHLILKPGDVLLKDDCSYPLSQLGARLLGSNWIHSAVYTGDGKIIDCGSKPYVAETQLDEFLVASNVAIYRPHFKSKDDLDSALDFLRKSLNRPFNRTFKLSSKNSFYCTQLIYRALQQMPHPIDLHVSLVGGRPAILAGDIEKCPDLDRIYLAKLGILKSGVSHVPSIAAALAGALFLSKIRPQFTGLGAFLGLTSALVVTEYCHNKKRKKELFNHAD